MGNPDLTGSPSKPKHRRRLRFKDGRLNFKLVSWKREMKLQIRTDDTVLINEQTENMF
jgi:hypothetical protein